MFSIFGSRGRQSRSNLTVRNRRPLSTTLERLEDRLLLAAVTLTTPSSNGGDGTWSQQQREGVDVYVGPAYLYYNVNPFSAFPGFQQGDDLYAKVDYFDEGSGNLRFQYDSVANNFDQTEFHTRSTRVDTQQFVSSYQFLEDVAVRQRRERSRLPSCCGGRSRRISNRVQRTLFR